MSKVMRSIKNVTHGYSSIQAKVREATSNDPWGPTGTQMSEIAQMTFNTSTEFYEIMDMLDKRLNDKGKNWRHVLKALKVLDYCLHEGSELVVTWARQSLYVIKTLREFQYIDEDGRDVGQNVRVAAKELTSLILDEERLRAERTDRKSWKSRVTGLEEHMPDPMLGGGSSSQAQRRPNRRPQNDEDDAEYRLALEASKAQEEEDRRKRESRHGENVDPDLEKALKLSKEEEERRRRDLEDQNANSLFGFDEPAQSSQPKPTGLNQGYQQGNQVNFMGNPIDQNQMMGQPTGYMQNPYQTGMMPNQTGFPNYNNNGFGMQQTGMGMDPYGQQQQQQQPPMPAFQQQQPTGFNPYAQQQAQQQQPSEPMPQPGSNNPWATNQSQQSMKPMQTGSNNPFAQFNNRPQASQPMSNLSALPEQKTLSSFGQPQQQQQSMPQAQLQQQQPQQSQMNFNQSQPGLNNQPKKELSEHESRLNALLASGDGMDTYGNSGELRIPAQHTAPGMFMNSAGSGAARLQAEATGNPFMRQQFTGMPNINYGGQNGAAGGAGQSNNPFGAQQQPQRQGQQPGQDLIQF